MMRGVFFAFYTKITKLFPQCWPGNTKVFNIFSTFDGFPARSTLFSALIAHFQHLTGAHHQRVFGRVEFLLCAHYLPAHAAVKSQCPGVGVQHRKHRVLMLRQLLPGEIQHLLADAPAPGALRHKKVLHLPGLVVYADRGIRHILGIVEVADPAFLLFLLQLRQEHLRGQGIQRFLHPAPGTNAPAALRKQLCGSLHLLGGLDQPDILAPLPLGDLVDYIDGKGASDKFTEELEEAVRSARQNERWRLDYMTLEYEYRQRYLEGKEEGREEGRAEGRERTIQKLHERGESIASIADIVELNEEEVKRVISELA